MSTDKTPVTEIVAHVVAQQVFARYARALDRHDLGALSELFTEEATWSFSVEGKPAGPPIAGRDAILAFVESTPRAPDTRQRHFLSTIAILPRAEGVIEASAYLALTSASQSGVQVGMTAAINISVHQLATKWQIGRLELDFDSAP